MPNSHRRQPTSANFAPSGLGVTGAILPTDFHLHAVLSSRPPRVGVLVPLGGLGKACTDSLHRESRSAAKAWLMLRHSFAPKQEILLD